jgi:hypothetical protein
MVLLMSLLHRILVPALLLVGVACAAPTDPPPDEGAVKSTASALMLDGNCPTITGDVYNCTNLKHDLVNRDSYVIFFDLDTWANERVELTNRGDIPVTVYAAQGFNKTDYYTRLEPGQSTVMERIDPVFPIYHVLFRPDVPAEKGTVHIDARPFKS